MDNKEYTIYEVMKKFNVSRTTVYNWEAKDLITTYLKSNKKYVVFNKGFYPDEAVKQNLVENIQFVTEQNSNFYKNKFLEADKKNIELSQKLNQYESIINDLNAKLSLRQKIESVNVPNTKSNEILDKIDALSSKIDKITLFLEKLANTEEKKGIFERLFKK